MASSHISIRPSGADLSPAISAAHAPQIHHHAPEPFVFVGRLASGRLEIVDTAAGERMRLTLDDAVSGHDLRVEIAREGGEVQRLNLRQERPGVFTSQAAPGEPHAFEATLILARAGSHEVLQFRMEEPGAHAPRERSARREAGS